MKQKIARRDFLIKTSTACLGGCMLLSPKGAAASMWQEGQPINPEKLCYCGYKCPDDCHFYVASVKDDPVLKREAYVEWGLKERHGLEFDPEKIFCFRCKPGDMPEGPVLTNCSVRSCAIQKGYQACVQCEELKRCEKDLWTRFPQFHEAVLNMQVKYQEQG